MKSNPNLKRRLSVSKRTSNSKSKDKINSMKWTRNNRRRMRKLQKRMKMQVRKEKMAIKTRKRIKRFRNYSKTERIAK